MSSPYAQAEGLRRLYAEDAARCVASRCRLARAVPAAAAHGRQARRANDRERELELEELKRVLSALFAQSDKEDRLKQQVGG